jgi:hypothetical protein
MRIEDDFVLRLIKQIVELIERLIEQLTRAQAAEVDLEKAGQSIDEAYKRLLNMDRQLFETLDVGNLARVLGDPDRIERTARLMQAEGDLLRARGDHRAADRRHRRALGLLKAAAPNPAVDDLLKSLTERTRLQK